MVKRKGLNERAQGISPRPHFLLVFLLVQQTAHLWNAYTFDRLPLVVLSLASDSAQKRFPINSPARLAESVELSLVLER